eukprot:1374890-Rhodomonas_salina.1
MRGVATLLPGERISESASAARYRLVERCSRSVPGLAQRGHRKSNLLTSLRESKPRGSEAGRSIMMQCVSPGYQTEPVQRGRWNSTLRDLRGGDGEGGGEADA